MSFELRVSIIWSFLGHIISKGDLTIEYTTRCRSNSNNHFQSATLLASLAYDN